MPGSGGNSTHSRGRVVLLGMRCAFTVPALEALLAEPGVDLQAVVLPAASPSPSDSVTAKVRENVITVHDLERRADLDDPAFRTALETIAPDFVVVACFPWRLPAWLRTLPTRACVNIHPSLLPDGRGPEPVFWAFRWGLAETGVTLHLMDAGFDTGPIVAQGRYPIPADSTLGSLERDLATRGARLLIDALPALLDGSAEASPQAATPSRPAPMPGPDDLVVPTTWSASRAARFIHAVAPTYGPIPVLVEANGWRLAVSDVIEGDDEAALPEPMRLTGSEARIRFTPGVLRCQLHTPSQPLRFH